MSRLTFVREALIQRRPVPDAAFDAVYPCWARDASPRFWTPVHVAMQASTLLRFAGARAVLDIGSGVGKFAVIASLAAGLRVTGVEQRAKLVESARVAAERYRATTEFVCAEIGQVDPRCYDAFYLFNPFEENLVGPEERLDDSVALGTERFAHDVALVERWLEEAPLGCSLVTYNGFGGCIPGSFRLTHSRRTGCHDVRLWIKRGPAKRKAFVEVRNNVFALPLPRGKRTPAG